MKPGARHPDKNSTEWLFWKLIHAHRCASDAVFTMYGIRECGQPMILFMLESYGENGVIATQKDLAELLGISQTTTAISLKSLERLGCVQRKPDERDMRRNSISITERGLEVAELFRRAFRDIDEAMYADFTDEEKVTIAEFYSRLTKNLMEKAKDAGS